MADGSLSQFKATLARKKARKDKSQGKFDRKKMGFKNPDSKPEFNFPKLSESELEKVKIDIRKKIKSDRRNELIILGIVFIALALLILYLN
ncbi:hypothetical protein [Ulvibacterium marinum]|uniref:Uncharacterized protein n=1 Tax=Ulvibacterium marinum TaxID=2419782 RepID=A0A3B0C9W0_9FLAO|nr:hypothetical protein [Ulvibacterium marinum]RKN83225.1 hypothetical protein D7Z94_05165 [Ulvibacterium marinum]